MTKKILLICAIIALTAGIVGLHATPASPTPIMGTLSMLPSVIPTNLPTQVLFTIAIPDPTLIPNSINLLRLGATGTQPTIIGVMHDDGKNGDAVAGDGIYSLQVTFNEPLTHVIQVQASAAFRGQLKRTLPGLLNLAVTIDGTTPLPPDPGPAGMVTLGGIDSNGDGVRDDIERYIALTYPQSARTRAALTQVALALQSEVIGASTQPLAISDALAWSYATDCLDYVTATGDADVSGLRTSMTIANALRTVALNTPSRAQAYFQASGQIGALTYSRPDFAGLASRCAVNPSSLPN
jgi:hypothetical protein